jgi:hypothetical protein
MKESLLGKKIKEDFSMMVCCNKCGFPVHTQRKNVFLTSSIISMIEYDNNVCESCGHQKDGTTIPVVYEHWQKICNKFLTERDDLIKFLNHYTFLSNEDKKKVCVELPRFMTPNYKSNGDMNEDDFLEPYSWGVVYNEVINNTKLSRIMVRDIDWKKIKEE